MFYFYPVKNKPDPSQPNMDKIRLEIIGLSYSQSQSGAYALILGDPAGNRRVPIIIGGLEAQAIAVELEKMKPARPLTHDLFRSFAEIYGVKLQEVIIDQFRQGVFHAKLVLEKDGKESVVDSRTSDAVALAIRFKCPIYSYETILAATAIPMDEKLPVDEAVTTPVDENPVNEFEEFSLPELEDYLGRAIESENYELASRIRDEISKRKQSL
jgi:hypothetical protein